MNSLYLVVLSEEELPLEEFLVCAPSGKEAMAIVESREDMTDRSLTVREVSTENKGVLFNWESS